MGMSSRFELIVTGGGEHTQNIIQEFRNFDDEASICLDKFGDSLNSGKWYDCDNTLKLFSCFHPNVIFILTREGEDSNFYKYYAKNGQLETAKGEIKYPSPKNDLFKGVV